MCLLFTSFPADFSVLLSPHFSLALILSAASLPYCCIFYGVPFVFFLIILSLGVPFSVPHRALFLPAPHFPLHPAIPHFAPYIHIHSRTSLCRPSSRPSFGSFWHSKISWDGLSRASCDSRTSPPHLANCSLYSPRNSSSCFIPGSCQRIPLSHRSDVSTAKFNLKPQVVLWQQISEAVSSNSCSLGCLTTPETCQRASSFSPSSLQGAWL